MCESSVSCEVYRSLRHALEDRLLGGKLVVITSSDPGEGKTFTSINTAVVASWKSRVLLVDGDVRRPNLRKAFPDQPTEGLMDYLNDAESDWREFVNPVSGNLHYLPAGTLSENASELISGQRYAALMDELREAYDLVIIDTSPVNRVVNTVLMAKKADAVLLVAMAGKTTVPALQYAAKRLLNANLVGYIMNRMTRGNDRYVQGLDYQGYRYGGYGYGYRYSQYGYGSYK